MSQSHAHDHGHDHDHDHTPTVTSANERKVLLVGNVDIQQGTARLRADQDRAAAELLRVCRPGGQIGMANWTPDGFIGQVFKTLGRHMPPPAGVKSPALWGTPARIRELFEPHASAIDLQPRHFAFRYRSPQHWIEVFKTYYGPLLKAYGALPAEGQAALTADLEALIARFNRSGDGSMVVPSEYLEIAITRR